MDKAPDAFRTISEVADELDVPQHVLRFWESRFTQIRPMKRAGGRRYYRPDDVDLLRGIRHLLYGEGYTIRGVQRILREQGPKLVQSVWQPGAAQPEGEPDDAGPAEVERLAPDEAARTLFGLLKSPDRPPPSDEAPQRREPSVDTIPREPRLSAPEGLPRAELSSDKLQRLHDVLRELGECRRIIDDALKGAAA